MEFKIRSKIINPHNTDEYFTVVEMLDDLVVAVDHTGVSNHLNRLNLIDGIIKGHSLYDESHLKQNLIRKLLNE